MRRGRQILLWMLLLGVLCGCGASGEAPGQGNLSGAGNATESQVVSDSGDNTSTDAENAHGDNSPADTEATRGNNTFTDAENAHGDNSPADTEATRGDNTSTDAENAHGDNSSTDAKNTSADDNTTADTEEQKKEEIEEGVEMTETNPAQYFERMMLTESYKKTLQTNPLMTQRFGADPYAMVYGDRVYFYMTADAFEYDAEGNIIDNTYGKIKTINVISTEDMVNFTDHGSIKAAGWDGAATWANNSWAPAAAWKEVDGEVKFFLYFANSGGGIGVLTSDSPTGPFVDPLGEALVSRNTPNCSDVLWLFDPAVLVDDDGRAYLYFGGGVPEGKVADPGTARVVELGEDMISIKGEPQTIDVPYLFEDSGIHKFGEKYYYTYCSNWQVDDAGTANGKIIGYLTMEEAVEQAEDGFSKYAATLTEEVTGENDFYMIFSGCDYQVKSWYFE